MMLGVQLVYSIYSPLTLRKHTMADKAESRRGQRTERETATGDQEWAQC